MYVLIIATYVHYGLVVSQQVYDGKASCEDAAVVVNELALKLRYHGNAYISSRCVPQDRSRP